VDEALSHNREVADDGANTRHHGDANPGSEGVSASSVHCAHVFLAAAGFPTLRIAWKNSAG